MKKSKRLPIIILLFLALALAALIYCSYSDKPLETISINEIKEIKVYAIPPEEEVVLSEAEAKSVIPLLQDLKVSKPGYKAFALGGQTVRITVEKTDGSTIEISNVGNVQIIVDGKSYRADYESAEAINNFANKVLKNGF